MCEMSKSDTENNAKSLIINPFPKVGSRFTLYEKKRRSTRASVRYSYFPVDSLKTARDEPYVLEVISYTKGMDNFRDPHNDIVCKIVNSNLKKTVNIKAYLIACGYYFAKEVV